jgi:cyclic pyranopterin phosphate synthase
MIIFKEFSMGFFKVFNLMSYQLIDRFGRKHDYLRISLTDKCNLRCLYCMPENVSFLPESKILSSREIIQLANLFVNYFGINKIRFTGGEPLVRRDADFVMKEISYLPVQLAITTNGVLLDKYLNLFHKIGLNSINVSLDSLSPERFFTITKRSGFHIIRNNIERSLLEGFKIKINMVVMQNVNDDEILDFIKWTVETKIHVRFIEFMPFSGNNWDWSKFVSHNELKERIESIFPIEKLTDKPNSTSKSYKVKGSEGTLSFISTVSEPFCSSCNRLRVSADGKLRNCLFARCEVDLLNALRNGINVEDLIIGNVLSKEPTHGGNTLHKDITHNRMITLGG